MKRPLDINGNEIIIGNWYWAQDRRLKILGVGKFAVPIGSTTILFWFNATGYSSESFSYAPAENPYSLFGVQP